MQRFASQGAWAGRAGEGCWDKGSRDAGGGDEAPPWGLQQDGERQKHRDRSALLPVTYKHAAEETSAQSKT